jgi:hypothetical protein
MALHIDLTGVEREKLGVLVNNLSVYAAQLLTRGGPALIPRALANLAKLRKEHAQFLKRLDELARVQNEESPLRLIEDLRSVPTDVAQILSLVRRCLFTSAFVGHLLAQPLNRPALSDETSEVRLH